MKHPSRSLPHPCDWQQSYKIYWFLNIQRVQSPRVPRKVANPIPTGAGRTSHNLGMSCCSPIRVEFFHFMMSEVTDPHEWQQVLLLNSISKRAVSLSLPQNTSFNPDPFIFWQEKLVEAVDLFNQHLKASIIVDLIRGFFQINASLLNRKSTFIMNNL